MVDQQRQSGIRLMLVLFAIGLLISVFMLFRSQVGGDQLNLLSRGWQLASKGNLIPYGNPLSSGGFAPGGFTSLFVGFPLIIWKDFHAPVILILIFHILAYILLDQSLKKIIGFRERVLFCIFYWLNPWRVYFSAHLWNPNYLFLFGAIHTWTSIRQRLSPAFTASLVHVIAIGIAVQIHPSSMILVIASALLWYRGYVKFHWTGISLGVFFIILSLVPWFAEAYQNPDIIPNDDKGFIGRGLIFLYPLLRGIMYWLRYASLSLSRDIVNFDFTQLLGLLGQTILRPITFFIAIIVGYLSLLAPLMANLWLWRSKNAPLFSRPTEKTSGEDWLKGYVKWVFLAAIISFAISPTTVMMWQGLIIMHVALLPLILWLGHLSRTDYRKVAKTGVALYLSLAIILLVCISIASPMYRKGGRSPIIIKVKELMPMVKELKIKEKCAVTLIESYDGESETIP
jgi:hypothetical protein